MRGGRRRGPPTPANSEKQSHVQRPVRSLRLDAPKTTRPVEAPGRPAGLGPCWPHLPLALIPRMWEVRGRSALLSGGTGRRDRCEEAVSPVTGRRSHGPPPWPPTWPTEQGRPGREGASTSVSTGQGWRVTMAPTGLPRGSLGQVGGWQLGPGRSGGTKKWHTPVSGPRKSGCWDARAGTSQVWGPVGQTRTENEPDPAKDGSEV